ncbi:ADP-heptose--lipopolysaccharide heptosyltransferase [Citrifermentans bemidjiense Bem]|uniref:ADP-heptose--lipopolysaccharide heptosyltransferase n=1 Tax=Citrifermentans bemidjiense (strain ATCC BAA-1014 / DSM 16622 / JCM 12645 / Bem) TaxID=404380 RepID=B5EEY7_CITBB|nr:glycosyltransferase family 9 protein [Citrifermentans bemidjiense]ACH37883.1 ADP-heptose--lipopolysaccharide heptosyltransferase [Citrifermentans bemidjiense Bem]
MNILIIKPGAIGDLLLITPVVRALRGIYPSARVTLVVSSRGTASLFSHNPLVNDVIVFDRKGEHSSWGSLFQLWRRIREKKFDLVLNFQRSNLKGWLLASAALPSRILVYHKAKRRIVHAVVNHLETLKPLGIEPANCEISLQIGVGKEDEAFAADLLRPLWLEGRDVVAVNPGASHPVNRWGVEHFAGLCDLLSERLGAKVIIVGGADDTVLADQIVAKATSSPVVLTGKTSLLQLGAILQKSALLVTGDTGPMHIATAVGTRVVALFGAADPERTGPVGEGHRVMQAREVACVPCRSRKCANENYLECMNRITPEQVFEAVKEMLLQPCRTSGSVCK